MLKGTLGKIIKGQKGQALPIVLILLVIGGLIIVPTLNYASTSLRGHEVVESNTLEFYSADSGIEDALHWIMKGKQTEDPSKWKQEGEKFWKRDIYNINARDVDVTVEEIDASEYKIVSIATSVDGSTTVLSTVWAIAFFEGGHEFNNQNPPPPGDIWVNGDATIAGNIKITGNFIASGDVTEMNNAKITGDVLVQGDLTLANNSEIHGTVCCGGDITLGNGCVIEGDIHVLGDHGAVTLAESGAKVEGNIWADEDLSIYILRNGDIGCEGKPNKGHVRASGLISHIKLAQPQAIIWGTVMDSKGEHSSPDEGKGGIKGMGTPEPNKPPDCPGFPTSPAQIMTWEIM